MSILVLGTVALDSLKTPHGEKKDLLGGSAAHFSMSASHFTDVNIAAIVGTDFPHKYINLFKRKEINTDSLIVKNGDTFSWTGEYKAEDLNNAVTLNTNLGVISNSIPTVTERQRNINTVFLANYDPDIQLEFLNSLNNPEFVGMDTMNLWINIKKQSVARLMKKVNLIILNDAEARSFTNEGNLLKAAKALVSFGPKLVIIKKGEHGGIVYSKEYLFVLPAYPLEEVIDPTGAGDTFAGGVMGYLSKTKKINYRTLIKAVSYGTIFSSFNVQGFGMDKTKNLGLDKVHKRMMLFRDFFKF
jgi:sugar/nucleoside kinase (ribokinase family)